MGTKKYSRRQLPPCPDPESYIVVKTDEGYYWRKKRGTVKKAKLNTILRRNATTAKLTGPAASRLLGTLEPHTRGIKKGKISLKIAGLLMKTYHTKGLLDFSMLQGLELNAAYPLAKLLYTDYKVLQDKRTIRLRLRSGYVQAQNNLVTDYYFDAVLLGGDPAFADSLKTVTDSSILYSFADKNIQDVELAVPLPPAGIPWILLLKVSCLEGNELAMHPKNYAMKVVKTGE